MALNVPIALKSADIGRFAQRALQLETAKPVIAYWCMMSMPNVGLYAHSLLGDYWIVNKILTKGLHNVDSDCLQYTTTMMDKLEQVRRSLAIG